VELLSIGHRGNTLVHSFGGHSLGYRVRKVQYQKGPYQKGPLYKGTRKAHFWIPERPIYFTSYRKGPQIGIFDGININGSYYILDKAIYDS